MYQDQYGNTHKHVHPLQSPSSREATTTFRAGQRRGTTQTSGPVPAPEDSPLTQAINCCSELKGEFGVPQVSHVPERSAATIFCSNEKNPNATRGGSPKPAMRFSCSSKATCQAFYQRIGRVISNRCKHKLQAALLVWKYFCFQQIYFDFWFQSENVSVCSTFVVGLYFWLGFFFLTQCQHFSSRKTQHSLVKKKKKTDFLPAASMEMFQIGLWWSNLNICHQTQDLTSSSSPCWIGSLGKWGCKITPSLCPFVTFPPSNFGIPEQISSTDGMRSWR